MIAVADVMRTDGERSGRAGASEAQAPEAKDLRLHHAEGPSRALIGGDCIINATAKDRVIHAVVREKDLHYLTFLN
jgi:hypothetical protein